MEDHPGLPPKDQEVAALKQHLRGGSPRKRARAGDRRGEKARLRRCGRGSSKEGRSAGEGKPKALTQFLSHGSASSSLSVRFLSSPTWGASPRVRALLDMSSADSSLKKNSAESPMERETTGAPAARLSSDSSLSCYVPEGEEGPAMWCQLALQ